MPPPPPPRGPPVTPSPHRFIIKKERVQRTPVAQEDHPRPAQFNATPRFAFSSTPRPTPTQEQPRATPAAARFLTPAPKTVNQRDVIEDPVDGLLPDSIEENQDVDFEYGSADAEDDYIIEEPVSKRRKLSSSPQPDLLGHGEADEVKPSIEELDDALSSSLPILSSPPAPKRPVSISTPRFQFSTPAPPPSSHLPLTQPAFLKPPRFRPPDPAESQAQSDPLPDQFSPHRKGQKYVPGGLAAEVRDWLVNLESAIPATGQKSKEGSWLVKILVDEVSGSGRAAMNLVKGRRMHERGMPDTSEVVRVILAGEGAGEGLQKASVVVSGKTVGIKGPLWEVVVAGEKWGVGVDWKVLS